MFTVKVKYKDNEYTYPKDITLLEISEQFTENYKFDIIVGSINNKLTELSAKVEKDCTIDFYDVSHLLGNRVYERGLTLIYIKAVKDILKCDVMIEHSIDRGIYTQVIRNADLTDEEVSSIKARIQELIDKKVPFERLSVSRLESIDYYESNKQFDKAESLKYISNSFISLYKLENVYDFLHGEMPVNTSYIKWFDLHKVTNNGLVLMFPNIYLDSKIEPYKHHEKLFKEFKSYHEWCDRIKVKNVSDLNNIIADGKIQDLIYMCEIEQNGHLLDVARDISSKPEVKIVLIAGPSSSGKTTTAKKLSLYLKSIGLEPHSLSIDDYFLDRCNTPCNAKGEPDFESLAAINVELFNEHLTKLLNYEEVSLPEYNFMDGVCELGKKKLKLSEKGILIIEGLHALNEDLTKSIPSEHKYKIYISPLTSINLDNHNRISTSDNRILRRMIRDNQYRGYKSNVTLAKWQDVREGEEKYVFPYQDAADVVFNTSLVYEFCVLRTYAEPLLFSVDDNDPYYGEAIRLLNILKNVLPIAGENIPLDSIIREFIGNSYFRE